MSACGSNGSGCGCSASPREGTVCPLCGGPNGCPLASDAPYKGSCWCMQLDMPEELMKRLPEESRGRSCICHRCVAEARRTERWMPRAKAGEFYFTEDGRFVFTQRYHLRRGYCCGNGCRHCPFDEEGRPRAEVLESMAGGAS